VGRELAAKVRVCRSALQRGRRLHRAKGIIIADTKFEFGVDDKGALYLIDEILTPDSSRFWPAAIRVGPPSFDKQIVRNWLETQPWSKHRMALPPGAEATSKYRKPSASGGRVAEPSREADVNSRRCPWNHNVRRAR
jgi:phosphoribosylaminoimidazole-succinocarboxamide synthase